jgi:hypothetical protein
MVSSRCRRQSNLSREEKRLNKDYYALCQPIKLKGGKELRFLKVLDGSFNEENAKLNEGVRDFVEKFDGQLCNSLFVEYMVDKFDLDFCEIKDNGLITQIDRSAL